MAVKLYYQNKVDKNCSSIPTTVGTTEVPWEKGKGLFYINSYKRLEETMDWTVDMCVLYILYICFADWIYEIKSELKIKENKTGHKNIILYNLCALPNIF